MVELLGKVTVYAELQNIITIFLFIDYLIGLFSYFVYMLGIVVKTVEQLQECAEKYNLI